jgi:hypothetical protein
VSRAWPKRCKHKNNARPIVNHIKPSRCNILKSSHGHFQIRLIDLGTSRYRILKTLVFCCPHLGQANMRLSNPGLSGLICLSTISVEHFGHASPVRRRPTSRLRRPELWGIGCAGTCRPTVYRREYSELSATDACQRPLSVMNLPWAQIGQIASHFKYRRGRVIGKGLIEESANEKAAQRRDDYLRFVLFFGCPLVVRPKRSKTSARRCRFAFRRTGLSNLFNRSDGTRTCSA